MQKITPVFRQNNSYGIILALINYIVSNNLSAGDVLPSERELATRLQVGRPSVREAFSTLELLGFVNNIQGKGRFVSANPPILVNPFMRMFINTSEQLSDFYRVRCSLEKITVEWAINNATDEDVENIQHELDSFRREVTHRIFMYGDANVHLAIAKASHSDAMLQLISGISNITSEAHLHVSYKIFSDNIFAQKLISQFEDIIDAIKTKDNEKGLRAITQHFISSEDIALSIFKVGRSYNKLFVEGKNNSPRD